MEALFQFVQILTKPDNIPIVFMLVLVLFFTWVGLKQALRNDRLIEQGREDAVYRGVGVDQVPAPHLSLMRATGMPDWMVWITVLTAPSSESKAQVAETIDSGMP